MEIKNYIKILRSHLNCSNAKKDEICKEIEADFALRMENGENVDEILSQMGKPEEIAREFNMNMGLPAEKKSKKKIWIISVAVIAVVAISVIAIQSRLPKQYQIGETGRFDENIVSQKCVEITELMYAEKYDEIINDYSTEEIKASITSDALAQAVKNRGADWGDFKKVQRIDMAELKQNGQWFAVGQITVLYDNLSVTYTLSFDEDMKLAGIYLK